MIPNMQQLIKYQASNQKGLGPSQSMIFQPQPFRIHQQLILIKQPSQKALVSSITCPICLLTLPLPYYECQVCNNNFCSQCIENWWLKNQLNQKQVHNQGEQQNQGKKPKQEYKTCIFKCENATFKKVKRSNTYVALFDALECTCNLCRQVMVLSKYQKHQTKQCPQIQLQCSNKNCRQLIKRKSYQQHLAQCPYRMQICVYCHKFFLFKQLTSHQEAPCPQKIINCRFPKCSKPMPFKCYQWHIKNCSERQVECQYCHQLFYHSQMSEHEDQCDERTVECKWCKTVLNHKEFMDHKEKCEMQSYVCELCQQSILVSGMKQHRSECMFANLVIIKRQNQSLIQQNLQLSQKLTQLQQLIQDTISNTEGKALEVMQKYRQSERKLLEKDLLRIQNSMSSINKLRDEEINAHLNRFKHFFGTGLCLQCKNLEKKFMDMKEPMIKKRREVLERIAEFDKLEETARG